MPDIRVCQAVSAVFRQPYLGLLPDTFFPRRLSLPAGGELEESPFAELDLIVVGDVASQNLSRTAWDLIEKFVSEAGGTLVLVAGKRHFPLSYSFPAVDRLLPVTDLKPLTPGGAAARGPPLERGFRLKLTPEGESEAMFQFDPDAVQNRALWSSLPGHMWGLMGRAKPGANVFAFSQQPGDPETLEAERNRALIVHQHYGLGQVLWLGIDSTWRWRYRVGDKYHHRFWGQLGRWAANNKAAVSNEFVRFGPERSDIQLGEDVLIRAQWTRPFAQRFPKLTAQAEIYRVDAKSDKPQSKPQPKLETKPKSAAPSASQSASQSKPFSTVELHPAENRPLVFEGRAVALPAGEYKIKLIAKDADLGVEEITTGLYVQEPKTLELSDLSANPELLKEMAQASGGRLFLPDQIAGIPELLKPPQQQTSHPEDIRLWDDWRLLLCFFALLTAEWVLRKLNGLP